MDKKHFFIRYYTRFKGYCSRIRVVVSYHSRRIYLTAPIVVSQAQRSGIRSDGRSIDASINSRIREFSKVLTSTLEAQEKAGTLSEISSRNLAALVSAAYDDATRKRGGVL